MLTRIIDWSLAHRWVVIAGSVVLVAIGTLAFRALPMDAFPDTTPIQVQVNTVAPALTPVEVERQITVRIEQVLAGLPKVEELRSISKFGLSQVTVRFGDDTNLWFARQLVAERVGTVALPSGLEKPTLGPVATGLGEVFHYQVRSPTRSLAEVRTLHDWVIAPQLRSVPGVAEINAWGGDEKQWHVVVDPPRLQKFDLVLGDVYRALEANNANVGGGVVERAGAASLVLGVGVLEDGPSIEDVVIAARDGVPVRVRDVAEVRVDREIRRGATTASGEGEIVLGLGFMLIGENSATVTAALARRLEEVTATLPKDVVVEPVYERTELVDLVLQTVRTNLFEGALLVIAVLFAFLGNLRAGLIVAMTIPLSMLFAFSAMWRFGIAGSLMSLGAIDFGLVVDSSVILVENAERRLAEARNDRSIVDVVRDAAVEVRTPTLFGELIIMVVYLPILALEGVEGKLFRPMALTVIFALLGSAVLSMTLVPVLAAMTLGRRRQHGPHAEPRLVRFLVATYRPILAWALSWRRLVLGGAALSLLVAMMAATRLGSEFVPRLSEGSIVINTVRLAEVALSESVRYGTQIEKVLLAKFPDEVRRVWTRTGTAEVATDPMGIELSDVFITLQPRTQWTRAVTQDELVAEMKAELADLPGMRMAFLQPIEMRVNEMISGVRSDVGIKIFGDDLDILKATARQVETVVQGIQGAADVTVEQVTGQPVLEVTVDRAAIGRYGIAAQDVLDVVAAIGARHTGEVREGERRFNLAVRLSDAYRSDPAKLATVTVRSPAGERVPLAALSTVREVVGPTTIQREWGKRRAVVQANVRGRDLGSFVAEARATLAERVSLPAGYYVRYGGQFENLERAQRRLMIVVPVALALIFFLLYLTYRRVLDCVRIFAGVPFALVGGVLALLLRGMPFSISAGVGFVALSGVSVLGDMVLVSRVRQLLAAGHTLDDAISTAALTRLRPVLMTALVAAFGFVPMALNSGVGAEVQRPLATVVIGGIVSSTLLTLVVLPVLYAVFGAARPVPSEQNAAEREPAPKRAPASALGSAFVLLGLIASLAIPGSAAALTLEEAIRTAVANNPEIRIAEGELAVAKARARGASLWFQDNPTFEGEAGPRDAPRDRFLDYNIALTQAIDISGQRGARIAAGSATVSAAVARIAAQRARTAAETQEAFGRVLASEAARSLADEAQGLAAEALLVAEERYRAGDASLIEVNSARIEGGRASREQALAVQREQLARGVLKLLVNVEPQLALEVEGDLADLTRRGVTSSTREEARSASTTRPELAAARYDLEAAKSAERLAAREALPRPRIGASYRREEDVPIVQGLLSVELPLFNRNDAARGESHARVAQAEAIVAAVERRTAQELAQARARYAAAELALAGYEDAVMSAAKENVSLATEGYRAGKLDFLQLSLIRRGSLEVRRGHIEALEELNAADAAFRRALGWSSEPQRVP